MFRLLLNLVYYLLKAWFSVFSLASLSFSFYMFFYFWYIPEYEAIHPIYFQYDIACQTQQMLTISSRKESAATELQKGLIPNCQFVHYELEHSNPNFFQHGQSYHFKLLLQMPDSEVNQNLGMFTVRLRLFDSNSNQIFSIGRPAILPYRSWLVRKTKQILYIVPLILNLFTETTTLTVALVDENANLRVDAFSEIDRVRLEIETLNSIEIIPPSLLHITANLKGPKYFMYFWPFLTGFTVISVIFSSLFFAYAIVQIYQSIPSFAEDELLAMGGNVAPAGDSRFLLAPDQQLRRRAGQHPALFQSTSAAVAQFDPREVTSFEPDSSETGQTTDKS